MRNSEAPAKTTPCGIDYDRLVDRLNRLGSIPPRPMKPMDLDVVLPVPVYYWTRRIEEDDSNYRYHDVRCDAYMTTTTAARHDTIYDPSNQRRDRFYFYWREHEGRTVSINGPIAAVGDVWSLGANVEALCDLIRGSVRSATGLCRVLGYDKPGSGHRPVDIFIRGSLSMKDELATIYDTPAVLAEIARILPIALDDKGKTRFDDDRPSRSITASDRRVNWPRKHLLGIPEDRIWGMGRREIVKASAARGTRGRWVDEINERFVDESTRRIATPLDETWTLSSGRVIDREPLLCTEPLWESKADDI